MYYCFNLKDYGFYAQVSIYPYDATTWEPKIDTYIYATSANLTTDMAVDPADGTIYAATLSPTRDSWFLSTLSFDLSAEKIESTQIAALDYQMSAMAFDSAGQLYGIATDGILYKIDKSDAGLVRVGDTGVSTNVDESGYAPTNPASGVIDPATGAMYWAVTTTDGSSKLYEVNTSTAEANAIVTFANQEIIRGLYIAEPEALDGSTAAATELEADFAPGNLTGMVSFKAPQKTYGGESISGNLQYRILTNGVQVASGSVYTGVTRSDDITLPEVGEYEISVILSNDIGDSPSAKLTVFAGYAAPATPVVTVRDYYGSLKVEWTAVEITDAEVTYRVVRYPDQVVVEEATVYTDVTDRIPASDRGIAYKYGVTAIANGTPSEEGYSGTIVTGSIKPPYEEHFTEDSALDLWTVADTNNDSFTWSFYNREMRSQASSGSAVDDWLISPPIAIEGFKYYIVSVDMKAASKDFPGKFELCYGTQPTAGAMTSTLIEPKVIDHENYITYQAIIRIVGESGNCYFGIHSLTDPGMWWLYATNFCVTAPINGEAPSAPSSLSVTPDSGGGLSAEINITAPATTIARRDAC